MSAADSPVINDREMATIRTTDTWNVSPIALRPGPLSRKEEDAVDVPETGEDETFQMDPDNIKPSYFEVQCMIEIALQIFEETTLKRRIRVVGETKVVSLLETAHQEAAKRENHLSTRPRKKSYPELSLGAVLMGTYTQRLITSPSQKNSSNTSHRI